MASLLVATTTAYATVDPQTITARPGVRSDFPAPTLTEYGRLGIRGFIDGGPVLYARTVGFAFAPEQLEGTFSPHVFLGGGVWIGQPHGLGEGTDDLLSDFKRPFGIRFGIAWGGTFAFREQALELSVDGSEDFSSFLFEFEIMGPWWAWGVGPDLIVSEWSFAGVSNEETSLRGETIPEGSTIKQRITQYAVGVPVGLFDNVDATLFEQAVPTMVGTYIKYSFLEFGASAESPEVEANVSNHVLAAGIWLDWGIARFLRLHVRGLIGAVLGHPNYVAEFKVGLTFRHIPEYWLDGHLEFIAKVEFELLNQGLGDRYLTKPAESDPFRNTINWTSTQIRLGLRILF